MTKKNPAAVQLGRRGGKAAAKTKKLSAQERKDRARKGALAMHAKRKGK
jgi:hypothetical protein